MPVISSTAKFDGPVQADGTRTVIASHDCGNGLVLSNMYPAVDGTDQTATLNTQAAAINGGLIDAETAANMANDGPLTLNEQTKAQFAAKVRAAYKNATAAEACRMAYWLLRRIANGDLTDAQCQNAFGLTATQWTNVKTNRLTPQSNAWASVLAAVGQ